MEPTLPTELRNDRKMRNSREVDGPVSVPSEATRCKVDLEHMLGIAGIVGAVLNLLVVVFVYIYTPV